MFGHEHLRAPREAPSTSTPKGVACDEEPSTGEGAILRKAPIVDAQHRVPVALWQHVERPRAARFDVDDQADDAGLAAARHHELADIIVGSAPRVPKLSGAAVLSEREHQHVGVVVAEERPAVLQRE